MEKILDALERCEHMSGAYCQKCFYLDEYESGIPPTCTARLAHDVLALLKAQYVKGTCTKERCQMNASTILDDCNIETCPWRTEALIPRLSINGLSYECPACGNHLTKDLDNYCAQCGRRVKWK